jgi:two-component system, NarL family, nitrate/nitrite response regulator NarL
MTIGIYSLDIDTITYLQKQLQHLNMLIIESDEELSAILAEDADTIVIFDYDTVAPTANRLIHEDRVPSRMVVLERCPTIKTGKMLLGHTVKAYGNARMLDLHLMQLLNTVRDGKVWMYPELMAAMIEETNTKDLYIDAELLDRLTEKEQEVTLLVLEGLTNDAIGRRLEITSRTVKAHLTSIFQKLHVNDRLSLVLLLK